MMSEDIRYIYAGDLLGQLIATSFGLKTYDVPLFGLYGACSTMGESLSLAAMCVNAGFADNVAAIASSHLQVLRSSSDFHYYMATRGQ